MRYGSRVAESQMRDGEEDERPLGSVSWADPAAGMTQRINTFNDPRSPATPAVQHGIRNGCSNIPYVATHNAHEQYRAMNRRKCVEEED